MKILADKFKFIINVLNLKPILAKERKAFIKIMWKINLIKFQIEYL